MTSTNDDDFKAVVGAALHCKALKIEVDTDSVSKDTTSAVRTLINSRINERMMDGDSPVDAMFALMMTAISVAAHLDVGCCSLDEQASMLAYGK